MTEPRGWDALLARLDTQQLEALALTVAAMTDGHLEAGELLEFATEANMAGIAYDLIVMQGPAAVAAKQRADTRAGLVADIQELALTACAIASDLDMAAGKLYDFDDHQAA